MSDRSPDDEDDPTQIVYMPIFDISNFHKDEFAVSRKTAALKDSVSSHANIFLQNTIKEAQKKYRNSNWLMIWENTGGRGFSTLSEEECEAGEYDGLSDLLANGRLYGCDLRGNSFTNQFGLVSNQKIPKKTFVAVEGGVIWSENIHDKFIEKEGDPLLGLSSNLIPARYLKSISGEKNWKQYKQDCKNAGEVKKNKIPGLVVECSFRGNETKHIDDPGWLFMASGDPVEEELHETPNLEARVILDLKGKGTITVGFETIRDVPENTELTMDWGCWDKIFNLLLPGHTLISLFAHKYILALEEIGHTEGIALKQEIQPSKATAAYFNPKDSIFECLGKLEIDKRKLFHAEEMEHFQNNSYFLGKQHRLLDAVMEGKATNFDITRKWCKSFDYDAEKYEMFAKVIRSDVSPTTRKKMKDVPDAASTYFNLAKAVINETFHDNVEVIEITDKCHPVKLYGLPDRQAFGLRAKKEILKGSPVLAYGGRIVQDLDYEASRDGYIFDAKLPEEYKGPQLYIDGRMSIGGMINDPWTPSGFRKRDGNLYAVHHWDEVTSTPQIVFYAIRTIDKGEELLYNYGDEYWRENWLKLMRDHAEYAAKVFHRCSSYRDQLKTEIDTNGWKKKYGNFYSLGDHVINMMKYMSHNDEESIAIKEEDDDTQDSHHNGKSGWVSKEERELQGRSLRSGVKF
ncbi:hypothetical protein CTEN210_18488 [Chaetoceros tenuissimus]|uniref:SET domain-containing protein n=1 Tax=Chaetoceros tenuissimus TaxID=426638 RepID=A0AAD3HFH7_9STRA|nr:hypothetical protein CTEN210_18488 [Chaetoceros tenuissimus]